MHTHVVLSYPTTMSIEVQPFWSLPSLLSSLSLSLSHTQACTRGLQADLQATPQVGSFLYLEEDQLIRVIV